MKKITLLAAIFAVSFMNAQNVIYSDDFEQDDFAKYTTLDEDGDGFNWIRYDPTIAGDGNEHHLSSKSYDGTAGALTPNNYVISPAIDVTGASDMELNYTAGGQDPDYSAEKYTVYVSTGNTIADFIDDTKTVSFTENLGDDPAAAGEQAPRTLDLKKLNGSTTVYIAFRHFESSDEFILNIDDISLEAATLGTQDQLFAGFTYYIDNTNRLNLSANTPMQNVQLYNVLGQSVINRKLNDTKESINISGLKTGIYIANVIIDGNKKSFKFVKK